jgi:hypothetical protein
MKNCPRCGKPLSENAQYCSCSADGNTGSASAAYGNEALKQPVSERIIRTIQEATGYFTAAISGKENPWKRVFSLMTKPGKEWAVIETEQTSSIRLFAGYVLILCLLPVLANLIREIFIDKDITAGILSVFYHLIMNTIVVFGLAKIVEMMAPSFFSEENFRRSFQLVVYSLTPFWIMGIFILFLGQNVFLFFLGWLYSVYLLKLGIPVLKKTAPDKVTGYLVLTVLVMVFGTFLVSGLLQVVL